ncbi:MAG: NUDIX hydrolase [Sulfuricaulis sp.]
MTENKTSIFHGKIVELYLESVRLPNGAQAQFEIVRHPGGAAVVALDRDARVCLLRQYRHAVGGWVWELPAGKLDPGEAPSVTAARELEEEAGLRATHWESLGEIISSPGVFTEVVHLFLARDLSIVPANAETHEVFEVHWVPFEEALTRAVAGELKDAKTLVGLFRTRHRLEQT